MLSETGASLADWVYSLTGLSLAGSLVLALALILALSFEFVNGFHDSANAVATVIYSQSLSPIMAVLWSGLWNLIGVLVSTGAVAFSIVMLLPAELVLNVDSGAGLAMIFALLSAAILWNLSTWFLGLPVSSSHTLIGSILGIGLTKALLQSGEVSAGVNWVIAQQVGLSLLLSPLIGFCGAGLLLLLLKWLLPQPDLYRAPESAAPPLWIRILLIFTCAGISFAHGSNDGQKGMGLIMLILAGLLPGFYTLNLHLSAADLAQLSGSMQQPSLVIPIWVKGAVALALALGTMVGWKRIVVTVGEQIGKDPLTYGQGAAAELVAMGTILAADTVGLPVSTTQVVSSGIAGTMVANGSGIQSRTVTNILLAWILTLPACMGLSGFLFAIGLAIVKRLGT